MKKVTIPTEIKGIDWSKPQWVIDQESNMAILTNGQHEGGKFEGTCLPCSCCLNGKFAKDWTKSYYKPLTFDIPFTISNSNE